MANLPLTLGNVLGTTQPGMTASNDVITLSSKPQYSINYVDVDAGLGTDQLRLTGYSTLTSGKFTISTPDSNGWIHIDTISGASSTEFHIRVKSVESVTFYGGTTVQLSYVDTTPPTLSTSNPVNTATGVAVNSNIVLTFSETVQKGSGAIEIHRGSATGTTVATYDAATNASNLTFSGNTLTINPTDDLANSTTYFVSIASGAVKDLANNSYSGTTTYDFTTVADTISPTITSFSPMDAATGVPAESNIVLTFSEAIQRGTGAIEIHSGSANGPTVATYDAATNISNLTFSGNTLTINPTNDLGSDGTQYFVTLASGTVKDLAVTPNLFTGTTTYDFFTLDTAPPTVAAFSPTDAAKGVAVGSNIVLTFSETIQKGTGAIEIHSGSATGTTVATYDAATNTSNLAFSGNTLTINPTSDLAGDGTQYYVTLASGTVKDVAGNPYAGTLTYDFFTLDTVLPTVTAFSPADAATGVAVGSNIVLTFSETIQKGTGTIEIHEGSSTGVLLEPAYDSATNTLNLTFSGNTLTINPTNLLVTDTQYFVTFATDSVRDSAGNSYSGTTTYDFRTTPTVDNIAPTISSFNPGDGVAGVAVNSNIVLTFSEAVQRGTGTIEIHRGSAAGTTVATYDAATNTSNLTFSGSTLTINPTDDLANSTTYFVTVGSLAVKDLSNNSYPGITTYDFTTAADIISPTVTAFSPTDAATGVPAASNIVLTFSEAIQRGTGAIEIHSGSANGPTVATYDAAINSSNLTFSGNTLTINPTNDLASDGTQYFVTLGAQTVKDLAGNLYAGTTTYDFFTLDTVLPTVTAFSPADSATGVPGASNIVLTFSEAIQKGAGVIAIHSGSVDGPAVASYDAATNTSNLTFSGNTLTINPTADLANDGTHYFITLAPGTIYDLAGNLYAGTTSYDFTTVDTTPPTVTAFSPTDATTGVAVGSNIVLTFSETIQKGTGAIEIHAGSETGTLLEPAYDAATNSSNLTFSGNTLTINPTNTLATDTHYFVTFAAGSVKDSIGNSYTGTTNYDFTTVDTIAPTVTSFSPTEAATGVPVGSDILITFSEAVHSGTGLIVIHSGSETGAVVASYESATNTSNLTFSGNMLTINPTDNLAADTHFFVTLQNGSVNDLAGNHYAGTAAYDFTTGADPYAGSSGSSSNIGVDAGPVVVGVGGLGVLAWVLFF